MTRIFIVILSASILSSCSPKISPNIIAKQSSLSDTEFILVLNDDEIFINNGIKVGTLKSSDKGFSTHCSFDEIIEIFKKICRENGANIINITQHIGPDLKSSCDRIEAIIYKVPDYKKHENAIEWTKSRKLTWSDFKGQPTSSTAPNYGAETSCGIAIKSNTVHLFNEAKIRVTNTFYCNQSWVQANNKQNNDLLEHEQLHFDLSEIHARQLRKKIAESKFNSFNLIRESNLLFNNYLALNIERQSQYDKDTEHGTNIELQKKWKQNIATELDQLKDYSTNE